LSKSDWDTAVEILTTVNIYQIVLMIKYGKQMNKRKT
jgi:hypothetical protein